MPETPDITKNPLNLISKRKENIDLSTYTFGKIPPQARDLEEAVLGAIYLDGKFVSAEICV